MKLTKEEIKSTIKSIQNTIQKSDRTTMSTGYFVNLARIVFKLQHQLKHLEDKENTND